MLSPGVKGKIILDQVEPVCFGYSLEAPQTPIVMVSAVKTRFVSSEFVATRLTDARRQTDNREFIFSAETGQRGGPSGASAVGRSGSP